MSFVDGLGETDLGSIKYLGQSCIALESIRQVAYWADIEGKYAGSASVELSQKGVFDTARITHILFVIIAA